MDCWRLECPPTSCARPVLRAGHCCASCDGDEADFCAARAGALRERLVLARTSTAPVLPSAANSGALAVLNSVNSTKTQPPPTPVGVLVAEAAAGHCTHMGRVWPPFAHWHPAADSCIICHCIVCSRIADARARCRVQILVTFCLSIR